MMLDNVDKTVFIVTYGRSGSTLLQAVLQTLPGACIRGENNNLLLPLFRAWKRAARGHGRHAAGDTGPASPWYGMDGFDPDAFGASLVDGFVRTVLRPAGGTRILGFKEVRYHEVHGQAEFDAFLDFIRRFFPGAHILFNSRRGADVARSAFWQKEDPADVEEWVAKWDGWYRDYAAAHPGATSHVQYEDYRDDAAALAPLFQALGETMDRAAVQTVLDTPLPHGGPAKQAHGSPTMQAGQEGTARKAKARLMLCATQRCGSTMIVEDMRNSGVLGRPKEWFLGWNPAQSDRGWQEELVRLCEQASSDNGVMAAKLMADQMDAVDACLGGGAAPTPDHRWLAAAFQDAAWVYLVRRDQVAQAVSRAMAEQTGIQHATGKPDDPHFAGHVAHGYDRNYNTQAVYDFERIKAHVLAIRRENALWEHFFEANGITPSRLIYEDVADDLHMAHLDLLGRLAGLPAAPPKKARRMVRLANEHNADWKARFVRDAASAGFS
ncbi:Stf0 family sulfotransferase [Yunchengibacter salinarum]|uniref:Stf0 family sulfotransferase n=1 Tax=Yunchengibacter salinarum TaxID=3133399 RepID=UPI0035B5828D